VSKLARFIEELLLPVIAAAALLVSLADLFGLFSLVPVSRIPMLTLLLVSLVLNSLILIQRRLAMIYERTQRPFSKIELEQVAEEMIAQIDTDLRKVFKDDYFLDVVGFFLTAIKESKVPVSDITRLRYYYIRTLRNYSKATFLSTQCLEASLLWEDHVIEEATATFIRNGGKIKRIIFVKDAQELALQETRAIIERQRRIGVQVCIVNSSITPTDLKKNFFVESKGKIAWEMQVNNGHLGATVTTNKQLATSYCSIFEKLRESEIHL